MIDPDLSVYAVPTVVVLHCETYVLARSLQDARIQASKSKIDLAEAFVYDDEKFEVEDLPRAKINDFYSIEVNNSSGKESEPVLQPDYPVEDHPDYDATLHDIPDAPEDDPDARMEQKRDDKRDFKDEPRDD